jgi:hypothetical protein
MLRKLRKILVSRQTDRRRVANLEALQREKARLRAMLVAVSVTNTTHYGLAARR